MYNELFVNVLIGCIMSHIVIGTLANRQIIKLLHMNRICNLFGIKYPIIQGGMVWCSGWRLASAVSNAGGLGLEQAPCIPRPYANTYRNAKRRQTNLSE